MALACPSLFAQTEQIPAVDTAPDIDGVMDESVWQQALVVDITYETRPAENAPAPVRTEVRVMETGSALYIAFRAEDPDPTQIRAFLRDRDSAFQDDIVGVVLDTFNDERRAFEFFANPLGSQMDLINNEVTGNEDESWDAIWDAAGTITDFGYVVEMEIPYKALQFPDQGDVQTWGVDLIRFYPRDTRRRLSVSPIDRNRNCYLCQLPKYEGMADARPGRNLEITPTITAVGSESRDNAGDPLSSDTSVEFGGDISWGFTPNFNLNATINPDFSQVEADVAQLDVNRTFALFFPEKRPFFLEGADFFESDLRLVYTRTIADPDVGLRITGKQDANVIGAFVAEDTITNLLIPGVFGSDLVSLDQSSTNAAVRYRRDIGETSTLGFISTVRVGDNGYHNYMIGTDGKWQPNEDHTLRFLLLGSDTEYPDEVVNDYDQKAGSFSDYVLRLRYNYSTRENDVYLIYDDRGEDFRADLGFVSQVGVQKAVVGYGHNWYAPDNHWWSRIRAGGDWDISRDELGRTVEEEWEASVWMEASYQSFTEVGFFVRERLWNNVVYDENGGFFFGRFRPISGLELQLFASAGERVDFSNDDVGDFTEISPRLNWNIGRHFQTNLRHTNQKLKRDGGTVFHANLSDLRFSWQFNLRQRLRLTLQYAKIERDLFLYDDPDDFNADFENLGTQLIYSYKVNPRTVFFAGYSDYAEQDDELASLTTFNKTLFIKLGYAWEP